MEQIENTVSVGLKVGGSEKLPTPSTVDAIKGLIAIRNYLKDISGVVDNSPNMSKQVHIMVKWQKCECSMIGFNRFVDHSDTYRSVRWYTHQQLTENALNKEIRNAFNEMSKK